MHRRFNIILLTFQLIATMAIIFGITYTPLQMSLLVILWSITFLPLTLSEIILFILTCIVYTLGSLLILERNVFQLSHPDIWKITYSYIFIYGFYFLHTKRVLGDSEVSNPWPGFVFGLCMMTIFFFISNELALDILLSILFITGLVIFRRKRDLYYVGYLILILIPMEFLGIYSGEWHYTFIYPIIFWFLYISNSGFILNRTLLPLSNYLAKIFR